MGPWWACDAALQTAELSIAHVCLRRTFSFQDFSSWIKKSAATEESPEVLAEKLLTAQILTVEGGNESNSWSGYVHLLASTRIETSS